MSVQTQSLMGCLENGAAALQACGLKPLRVESHNKLPPKCLGMVLGIPGQRHFPPGLPLSVGFPQETNTLGLVWL